jgi:hypothetical protein
MMEGSHPPHSHALAPSDFSLVGDVKRRLSGFSFDNADDLRSAIHGILDGFVRRMFIGVVAEGARKLGQCFDREGDEIG